MNRLIVLVFLLTNTLLVSATDRVQQKVIIISDHLKLIQLTDHCFVHESVAYFENYGNVNCNGLIVFKNGKALMIDTPMNNEQTKELYTFMKDSMNAIVTTFIGGHFHEDCIGGMGFLKEMGVKCILGKLTHEKCIALNLPLPDLQFETTFDFSFEGLNTQCRYFGGGHTNDNIVVYIPEEKVFFGGCLIKSMDAQTIGNIADANIPQWTSTVKKVKGAFPDFEVVVPGHGAFGGKELLDHTIDIVDNYLKAKN